MRERKELSRKEFLYIMGGFVGTILFEGTRRTLSSSSENLSESTTPPAELLRFPENRPIPSLIYTIEEGDTLSGIADRFSTQEEDLIRVNQIDDPDKINIGEQLIIPFPSSLDFLMDVKNQEMPIFSQEFYLKQREYDLFYEGNKYYRGELDSCPLKQEGLAHAYGFNSQAEALNTTTSSGEKFDPNKFICASWFFPIGTKLEVEYQGNKVNCLVLDRGPNRLYRYPPTDEIPYYHTKNVIIDLSVATARALEPNIGILPGQIGEIKVKVRLLELPPDWSPQIYQ